MSQSKTFKTFTSDFEDRVKQDVNHGFGRQRWKLGERLRIESCHDVPCFEHRNIHKTHLVFICSFAFSRFDFSITQISVTWMAFPSPMFPLVVV